MSDFFFGAGVKGNYYRKLLDKFDLFTGFIDNDSKKKSEDTVNLEDFTKTFKHGWIVLCAANNDIILEMKSLIADFEISKEVFLYMTQNFFGEIFPILSAYILGKCYDFLCQISVTECCTLKCEKCAHGCWNVPENQEDFSLDMVKESADYYFNGKR